MESPIEENLPELCITTLFCTANLGCTVNLRKICQKRWNVEYCHRRSFATLRIRNPMATAQIYQSGKMIVSGVRSESEGRMVVRKFARIVQKTDTDCQVKLGIFKVRNIVGYYHFDFKSIIELSELAHQIGKSACYEPELTPNHLTYYPLKDRRIAVSVNATGHVKVCMVWIRRSCALVWWVGGVLGTAVDLVPCLILCMCPRAVSILGVRYFWTLSAVSPGQPT